MFSIEKYFKNKILGKISKFFSINHRKKSEINRENIIKIQEVKQIKISSRNTEIVQNPLESPKFSLIHLVLHELVSEEVFEMNLQLYSTARQVINFFFRPRLVHKELPSRYILINESNGAFVEGDLSLFNLECSRQEDKIILCPLNEEGEINASLLNKFEPLYSRISNESIDETLSANLLIYNIETKETHEMVCPLYTTGLEIIDELFNIGFLGKRPTDYILVSKLNGAIINRQTSIYTANCTENANLLLFPVIEFFKIIRLRKRISRIPDEILFQGFENIKGYLKRFDQELKVGATEPLGECKLIFIGSGEVGKTSLINRIVRDIFNEDENKTNGIKITKWKTDTNDKNIKLNIWDFGGQEIMHATHKFFMTRRSIYVLVINPRIQDQHIGDIELNYWLKLISSYGGDSPIIVVINKCEMHKIEIGRGVLMDNFPQIIGFVKTSAKLGIGIKDLESLVKEAVLKLSHVNDIIPMSYFNIKQQLESTNKDYLHYREYINICKEIDSGFSEEDSKILVGLLNDLGVMLNIAENRRLIETQVLNPEWITNGVYSIINSDKLIDNKGLLNENEIKLILDSTIYPTMKERGFIMDMMSHFELCYQIPYEKDSYFVPGAFPKDKPSSLKWNFDNYIHFQIKYDVLPSSIISRFLVKAHSKILNNNYWRNGALIKEDNYSALIEAVPFEKKIIIKVAGEPDARGLLTAIRRDFEQIHKSISKIRTESFVVLDKEGEIAVNIEELLILEKAGYNEYFETKNRNKYNIKELLNGIVKRDNFAELRHALGKGSVQEVINTLKLMYPEEDEIILLSARFNRLEEGGISGIINDKVYREEMNRITHSILQLINNLARRRI